jgi:internalin A
VFSPDPLYTDYQMADEALQNCVAQHIERSSISHAGDLTDLNCSQAGITSIDGLQTFHGLRGIKLSHNRIRSIQALTDLKHLSELYVDDNHLRNVAVLNRMEALTMVNLSGNPDLLCNEIPSSLKLADNDLPEHCR